MTSHTILSNPAFVDSQAKLICQLIGGSTLYGLNTATSDVDFRGIFSVNNKRYVTGFRTVESIVETGEVDSAYYELKHYLQLLRKTNTQVLEILFAPLSSFTHTTSTFTQMRNHRYSLIDSQLLKKSLAGYIHSEMRLATGERSGQLGGKRKAQVEKHGFSPKNFVQILRLCFVGQHFFTNGEYAVCVKDFDANYHNTLMQIKTCPEQFTCESLVSMVDDQRAKLYEIMDSSDVKFLFDENLAADLILQTQSYR